MAQGLSWTHAPYRGTADTLRALLGGEIDFASESSGWAPMVQAGQLRLLAVFTADRAKRFAVTRTAAPAPRTSSQQAA